MARRYRQAAVIPYRIRHDRMEVALVTTPGGKRWVVPKGSLDDGEDAVDAAIRETEEEAGLLGDLEPDALGRYRFTRNNDRYDVHVFLMRVTVVLDYWSEARLRRRRWLTVEEAALVIRADLRPFVLKAQRLVGARHPRAARRVSASGSAARPRPS